MALLPRVAIVPADSPVFVGRNQIWKAVALGSLILWLYAAILGHLFEQWWTDPNFSHGFLAPPFAAFVLWRNRKSLSVLPAAPAVTGLPIIIISLIVFV